MPTTPLEPDFGRGLIAREYYHLFTNTGKNKQSRGLSLSRHDFHHGNTIFPFDRAPDSCNMAHRHVVPKPEEGPCELGLGWRKETPCDITVLVMATFEQIVSLAPGTGEPTAIDI